MSLADRKCDVFSQRNVCLIVRRRKSLQASKYLQLDVESSHRARLSCVLSLFSFLLYSAHSRFTLQRAHCTLTLHIHVEREGIECDRIDGFHHYH